MYERLFAEENCGSTLLQYRYITLDTSSWSFCRFSVSIWDRISPNSFLFSVFFSIRFLLPEMVLLVGRPGLRLWLRFWLVSVLLPLGMDGPASGSASSSLLRSPVSSVASSCSPWKHKQYTIFKHVEICSCC